MKYAREIMELMGAYPGRDFRMREIIRYVNVSPKNQKERSAANQGVFRVLNMLAETGAVIKIPSGVGNGSYTRYRWKP
jgi:hypothetical protein